MSAEVATQSRPATTESGRGTGKRANRSRGGNNNNRESNRNSRPATNTKGKEVVVAEGENSQVPVKQLAAVALSEDGDVEICFICAEPVKYYAVSECNHRTCHICAIRLRALYKKRDCTFCKEPQNHVIFTKSREDPYSSFTPESIPFKDAKLSVSFETQEMMEETLVLLRFTCADDECDYVGTGWGDLKLHARAMHGKLMCFLNYETLERHFNTAHFACTQTDCLARKFVVFNTALDLKAHMVEAHGGEMSARDKKDARRIQAEFAFEEVGYGGRHGRRDRDRDREPPPQQQQPQPSTSVPPRPAAGGNRRRDGFGGALTTEAGPTPAQSRQPPPRPETRPSTPQPTPESLDPANLERHGAFLTRLNTLAPNPTTAIPAVRAATRGYRFSETSARDLILTVWNVLDRNLEYTASIINAFVDLLDEEEKKRDLLESWNGFAIEQRRQFPDLVPVSFGTGYAGITSGRVLNAKHSTAARSSQSQQVWNRVALAANNAAPGSSTGAPRPKLLTPQTSQERFPALGGGASTSGGAGAASSSQPLAPSFRQAQRTTPWSGSSVQPSTLRSQSNPGPTSVNMRVSKSAGSKQPPPPKLSSALFPELPSSANSRSKPQVSGNVSLKNILGSSGVPAVAAWSSGSGGGAGPTTQTEGEGSAAPGTNSAGPGDAATTGGGAGKGKKSKGKQKQTLFTLGSFPT
ncbi:E3 ubiquitin-protein ligase hel2 [Psilocybe cubensis]|uniref:E3 ubiquitin-protein ligase hel2 n=2 Tax=Psilocybe cubensis TaxID=181762 RepID=A0ACB8H904_PSICU|nr:E3 ubiquitin-protein ligase hel2 [Psilocybe cubensis]KAH9484495.1 E3 ubiquitin-protein ligase hel2 [Psilocybe cubensis]